MIEDKNNRNYVTGEQMFRMLAEKLGLENHSVLSARVQMDTGKLATIQVTIVPTPEQVDSIIEFILAKDIFRDKPTKPQPYRLPINQKIMNELEELIASTRPSDANRAMAQIAEDNGMCTFSKLVNVDEELTGSFIDIINLDTVVFHDGSRINFDGVRWAAHHPKLTDAQVAMLDLQEEGFQHSDLKNVNYQESRKYDNYRYDFMDGTSIVYAGGRWHIDEPTLDL
jgi:hypothetical protein